MLDVFRIVARWDGSRLHVQPLFDQGWELLALEARPSVPPVTLACSDIHSIDSFNLEAVLYQVQREIGNCWEAAASAQRLKAADQLRAD